MSSTIHRIYCAFYLSGEMDKVDINYEYSTLGLCFFHSKYKFTNVATVKMSLKGVNDKGGIIIQEQC